jgi:putative transposase
MAKARNALRNRGSFRDAALVEKLRDIAHARPRLGYRRAWTLLRRERPAVNAKRVHWFWGKERLALSRRRPRIRRRLGPQRQRNPVGINSV